MIIYYLLPLYLATKAICPLCEVQHAGIPVIACHTGGIPLQIEDRKSGYLTHPGDTTAVAKHLYNLYNDIPLYHKMSKYARTRISDEVSTVGNAAAWLYLTVMYHRGKKIKPDGVWLNNLLREETDEQYVAGEPRLPRDIKC
ncbi:glycosyltransferase family 4 protein [Laccaria bicolor S238N-H82]|uniref:Glycosyltransferase family 4 protein n=1 Tax=Laccaria bicolor (strain S238N-H82 / ATCC MYA-4686) TaxID=486041 RepID=B0D5E5_LACBS|nr:glycosyltransferase family 4 protein [Laccaria bicolor S238N-H82]EDR10007.1 glycosyltransferase family 4 protein [Laccaria bicolor S238N-H82]|eukprot:XP_001879392.1 glycosyltransferase family 4 protein [Laccaria bicolor S238N-H82]